MPITFEKLNLDPLILKAVIAQGYTIPTPIQQQAIPLILAGHDVIGKAPTGTGKTAAFMLPALHQVANNKNRTKPQILVLTPTRELATQITDVIYKYGKDIRVNAVSILGGMPYREQQRKLSRPLDIIVATPGRLIDYIERGDLDFSQISMVILDEADRMLDMGFIEDVEFIVSKTPKKRQTLLFTATMDGRLIKLSKNILRDPKHVEIKNERVTLDSISQRIHLANDNDHKLRLLQHLLGEENIFKAIIFSATKRNADKLTRELTQTGYRVSALHGDMNQRKRNRTITDFRSGKIQFVVATDVAARGIDINDISHVINYDLPKFAEDYVHRIGRTGRAGKDGIAISFVLSSDHVNLKKIERFTAQTIPHKTIAGLEPRPQRSHSGGSSSGGGYQGQRRSGGQGQSRGGYAGKKPTNSRYSAYDKPRERDGNSSEGFKREGFKKEGFRKSFAKPSEGFKKEGFRKPFEKPRGEKSSEGFKKEGFRKPFEKPRGEGFGEGFKKEGFRKSFEKPRGEKSSEGFKKEGFKKEGFRKSFAKPSEGFKKDGFKKDGFKKDGVKKDFKKPFKKPFKKREVE